MDELSLKLKHLMVANIGEEVSCMVGDEHVSLTRQICPEILAQLLPFKDDIIIVQKALNGTKFRYVSESRQTVLSDSTGLHVAANLTKFGEAYVGGSPLKCSFNLDESPGDFTPFILSDWSTGSKAKTGLMYVPVDATKAPKLGTMLSASLRDLSTHSLTLPICLCLDGKNSEGTIFTFMNWTGMLQTEGIITASGPLRYISLNEGVAESNLGEKIANISIEDKNKPDLEKTVPIPLSQFPSLENIVGRHTLFCDSKIIKSMVESVYHVITVEEETNEQASKGHSSLSFLCDWKHPTAVLAQPPPDATSIATVEVDCGDQRIVTYRMYKQLSVVKMFVTGLTTGKMDWPKARERTVEQQLAELFCILGEQKRNIVHEAESDIVIESDKMSFVLTAITEGKNGEMDFTDHLWEVLKNSSSLQELREGLKQVFMALAAGDVRPQIHKKNETRIGSFIRVATCQAGDMPSLEGNKPLCMLVEMGLEKVKRDYISMFHHAGLATHEQLAGFIDVIGDDDALKTKRLEGLHVTLSAVSILAMNFQLNQSVLAGFTGQVLDQLRLDLSLCKFMFALPSISAVSKVVTTDLLQSWRLHLSCKHEDLFDRETVAIFTAQPLVEYSSAVNDSTKANDDGSESVNYYLTTSSWIIDDPPIY